MFPFLATFASAFCWGFFHQEDTMEADEFLKEASVMKKVRMCFHWQGMQCYVRKHSGSSVF